MFKVLSVIALCVAVASAASYYQSGVSIRNHGVIVNPALVKNAVKGIVDPAFRCGGVGTPIQLRISDCDGYCTLKPGTPYDLEEDFFPSSPSPSLTLKVTITTGGLTFEILEAVLPNSSVQPGNMYTVRYTIVPNDILTGRTVEFKGEILHTDTRLVEICVAADIDIA